MGNIELKIDSNIPAVQAFLSKAEKTLLAKAIKRTLTRSIKSLVTESTRALMKKRALKAKDIKAKWLKTTKSFKGFNVDQYQAIMHVRDKKIPMIDLVRGSKFPRDQKGISVKRRKGVKVTLSPGKTVLIKGGFIARGPKTRGIKNVFRRETTHKGPIVKQSLPSLHLYFMLNGFIQPIEKIVGIRMQKEFMYAYKYLLSKEAQKVGHPIPMIR